MAKIDFDGALSQTNFFTDTFQRTVTTLALAEFCLQQRRAGEIYNIVDDEPVGMNEWLTNAAHTLNAKPPFSVPLWLVRLLMPYMAVIFETRLPVSNRKAKDELSWQLKYQSYREGLREIATS